mgnify:FL=1
MEQLDAKDIEILSILQEDATLTTKELASKVHLSTTPVFERVKRLEREGYIRKYAAILDADKLGKGFIVYCSVRLLRMGKDTAEDFVLKVKGIPEVTECYNISGEYDYLMKVHAPNMKYYQQFLINVIGTIGSVGSVQSTFVMQEIKQSYSLSL